jgi:hypothetical protein
MKPAKSQQDIGSGCWLVSNATLKQLNYVCLQHKFVGVFVTRILFRTTCASHVNRLSSILHLCWVISSWSQSLLEDSSAKQGASWVTKKDVKFCFH